MLASRARRAGATRDDRHPPRHGQVDAVRPVAEFWNETMPARPARIISRAPRRPAGRLQRQGQHHHVERPSSKSARPRRCRPARPVRRARRRRGRPRRTSRPRGRAAAVADSCASSVAGPAAEVEHPRAARDDAGDDRRGRAQRHSHRPPRRPRAVEERGHGAVVLGDVEQEGVVAVGRGDLAERHRAPAAAACARSRASAPCRTASRCRRRRRGTASAPASARRRRRTGSANGSK